MFLSKQAVKTQREDNEDKHAHVTISLPDSNTHCSEQYVSYQAHMNITEHADTNVEFVSVPCCIHKMRTVLNSTLHFCVFFSTNANGALMYSKLKKLSI